MAQEASLPPRDTGGIGATIEGRRGAALTAAVVAERAVATSESVASARADVQAARASETESEEKFLPKLTLSGSYTRLSEITPPSLGINLAAAPTLPVGPIPAGAQLENVSLHLVTPVNQFSFDAGIVIPISDYLLRLTQEHSSASHSRRAAELEHEVRKLTIAANAKIAYYAWARARLAIPVALEGLAQVRAHLSEVQSLQRNGAASIADVLRVESQVATNEQAVAQAYSLERDSAEHLQVLMHVRGPFEWQLGEALSPLRREDTQLDVDALAAEAALRRLEVRALGEEEASAIQRASAANAAILPRLEAFGQITTADPNQRFVPNQERFDTTWAAGARVSWSPDGSLEGAAARRVLEARARRAAAERAAFVDELRDEVSSALRRWTDANVAIVDDQHFVLSFTHQAGQLDDFVVGCGMAGDVDHSNAPVRKIAL